MSERNLPAPEMVVMEKDGKRSTVTEKAFESVYKTRGYKLVIDDESEIKSDESDVVSEKAPRRVKSGSSTSGD